jgi:hypothetical protein
LPNPEHLVAMVLTVAMMPVGILVLFLKIIILLFFGS